MPNPNTSPRNEPPVLARKRLGDGAYVMIRRQRISGGGLHPTHIEVTAHGGLTDSIAGAEAMYDAICRAIERVKRRRKDRGTP